MRHLSSATVAAVVTALLLAAPAMASWGENGKCQRESSPVNRHCYFLAERQAERWGTIAYDSIKRANVSDWNEGSFVSMESWIFFNGRNPGNEWIETGSIVGWYTSSPSNWTRFNARQSKLDGFNIFWEKQNFATPYYARYGLMDLSELEAWDVLYEGLGGTCGSEWCKQNRYGSWPFEFSGAESGMEVGSEFQPTVEGAQSVGSVEAPASGVYNAGKTFLLLNGPFEAWCGGNTVRQTDPNGRITANPDVGTSKYCGGVYWQGDINVVVEPGVVQAGVRAAPRNEAAVLGKPHDTVVHREGDTERLESKDGKFHPIVPLPKDATGPTGHDEVLRRAPGGQIQAMWVGEGVPRGEAKKLLEPQPEVGAPPAGSGAPQLTWSGELS
jgi:hypothetical protein